MREELAIKRINKAITILITFLLFFSIVNQVITTNVVANQELESAEDEPNLGLMGNLLKIFGFLIAKLSPINQMFLVAVTADPVYVEIEYGETVTVEAGLLNLKTNYFQFFNKSLEDAFFEDRYMKFEVIEYPGGNTDEVWQVNFEPEILFLKKGIYLKTNASISLIAPPNSRNAVQSGILKIRIFDTWVYGDLWFPPNTGMYSEFPYNIMWMISSFITMKFGRFSGSVSVDEKDLNILVKVKPYHKAKLETLSLVKMRPNEITSIPIKIENDGNYNDTFNFRVISKNDNIVISEPVSITLAPGESKDTFIGVSALPSLFDYGTVHKIKIEAYSVNDENSTAATRTILVETKGVFVSETMGILFVSFIAIVIFAFAYSARRQKNIIKKPKKEIKKKEKKTKKDSKDKKKKSDSDSIFSNFFQKTKKDKKEKKKKEPKKQEKTEIKKEKSEPKEEKKLEIKQKKIEEEKPVEKVVIDKKVEAEKRKKEKALNRIKKDQLKQKRKIERRMK